MAVEYIVEETTGGLRLNRKRLDRVSIDLLNGSDGGLCRADINDSSKPRDIAFYRENVLKPLITAGKISDGSNSPFDDRKMRYYNSSDYSSSLDRDSVVFRFGHSHYGEFKEQLQRKDETKEAYIARTTELKERGKRDFNEEWAYFSRAPGIAAGIITLDKKVIVGERIVQLEPGKSDAYQGKLQLVHGHLQYRDNPRDVKLEEDVKREIQEETGVDPKDIEDIKFVGLFSSPDIIGDLDFGHLAFVKVPSSYFTSGQWKERVSKKEREHKELVALSGFAELKNVIDNGVMPNYARLEPLYSAQAVLESIEQDELA